MTQSGRKKTEEQCLRTQNFGNDIIGLIQWVRFLSIDHISTGFCDAGTMMYHGSLRQHLAVWSVSIAGFCTVASHTWQSWSGG